MKKFSIAIVVACLMALTAGSAVADSFTDTIVFPDNYVAGGNPYIPQYKGHKLVQGGDPLTYQHNLANALPVGVDIENGDIVNTAKLILTFWDQGFDTSGEGYCERVDVVFNSNAGVWNLGEVVNYGRNPGDQSYTNNDEILVEWLNDEANGGILAVSVTVFNNDNGGWVWWPFWWEDGRDADVWMTSSTLTGDFTPVPVPGAVLLGVLGLGAAGMRLRKNKVA